MYLFLSDFSSQLGNKCCPRLLSHLIIMLWTSRRVTGPSRTQASLRGRRLKVRERRKTDETCEAREDRVREARGVRACAILPRSFWPFSSPSTACHAGCSQIRVYLFSPSLDLRWISIKHLAISLVGWWYRIFFSERPGAHYIFHLFACSLRRVKPCSFVFFCFYRL